MQRLLGEAVWDADAVRDDVRGYVIDTIGHSEAVLILGKRCRCRWMCLLWTKWAPRWTRRLPTSGGWTSW
jgi:hypothetical protein